MQCSPVKKSMYRYDLSGVRSFFLFPPLCHCFIHTRICGDFSSFLFIPFIFFYTVLLFSSAKDFFFLKGKCLTLLYNIMLKKGKKRRIVLGIYRILLPSFLSCESGRNTVGAHMFRRCDLPDRCNSSMYCK